MKFVADIALPRRLVYYGLLIVLAGIPVHAPLTTWLISMGGDELLITAWKEIVLGALLIPAGYLLIQDAELRHGFFSSWLNRLTLLYALIHVMSAVLFTNQPLAEWAGLALNLRFILIFWLAQIASFYLTSSQYWKLVRYGVFAVVIFGLMQVLLLPDYFLQLFGYGPETIPPFQTIDQNTDYVRIISTLRGANPLGLYLILGLPLIAHWLTAQTAWLQDRKEVLWRLFILTAAMITLGFTFSRSAWLGSALSVGGFLYLIAKPAIRRLLLYGTLALVVQAAAVVFLFSETNLVQNLVFHNDPESVNVTSNEERADAQAIALADIGDSPIIGDGVGSAGPASFYGDRAEIAENYYLQIAQEVGLLGLGLFLSIVGLLGWQLWQLRTGAGYVLLSSLIGLSLASFFLHVWAQDAVALSWWILAGSVTAVNSK
jgi:O-antigen ligase